MSTNDQTTSTQNPPDAASPDVADLVDANVLEPTVTVVQSSGRRQLVRITFALALAVLVGQAGIIGFEAGTLGTQSRFERVYLDMQSIARGLRNYERDGFLSADGTDHVNWMFGPGDMPASLPFDRAGQAQAMSDVNRRPANWYIHVLMPDPWGNAYLANVEGLAAGTQRIKVVSAGPDGVLDTSGSATRAQGDDVLVHLY